MAGISRIGAIAFTALVALQPCAASAGSDDVVLPPGAMTWTYECKPGVECPTKCSMKGTELFSTGNYLSFTIIQIPAQAFWFRIDTGQTFVHYFIAQNNIADQVSCSIAGATLMSARAQDSAKPAPAAPRP